MKATTLLERLRAYIGTLPVDRRALRAYIEGKPLPPGTTPKTAELAVRLKSFVERARHEAEGDSTLHAGLTRDLEDERDG